MNRAGAASRSEIAYGATRGLLLGLLVAAVETLLVTLATWLWVGGERYVAQTASTFLVTLAFYLPLAGAWGLIAGLAARGARRWIPREQREARIDLAVTLALPLAVALHATAQGWPSDWRQALPGGLALLAGLLLICAITLGRLRGRLEPWLGPWTLGSALLGAGWLLEGPLAGRGPAFCAGVVLAALASVLACAWLVRRVRPGLAPLGAAPILLLGLLACTLSATLRERVGVARAGAIAGGGEAVRRVHRSGPGQPNVLVVTLGSTRADHFSAWGYARDTAPHLDALGQEALRFERAIAAADSSLASHASLFTGLYPPAHGASPGPSAPFVEPLDPRVATLAEILSANGFVTLAVVASHRSLAGPCGLGRGFDVYDDRAPVPVLSLPPAFALRGRVLEFLRARLPERAFDLRRRDARTIADELLARLEDLGARRERWFAFANFMDAHAPCDPPEPFRDLFPGRTPGLSHADLERLCEDVNAARRTLEPELREHLVSQYDGAIAYVDEELGRVMRGLKESGEWERTLVVVTADHGTAFGEHATLGPGRSVYEEQVHVPLWFKLPDGHSGDPPGDPTGELSGSRTAGVVRSRVSLIDVLPSILEVLALEVPRELHGRSFRREVPDPRRVIFAEHPPSPGLAGSAPRLAGAQRAVYYGARKLVATTDGRLEIYDLVRDPDELAPSLEAAGSGKSRMASELERYGRGLGFGRSSAEPGRCGGAFLPPPPGYVH